jgi:chromate transport protein ChrA
MAAFISSCRQSSMCASMLLALVAWQLFRATGQKSIKWRTVLLVVFSFFALVVFKFQPQYVFITAGVLGLFLFR